MSAFGEEAQPMYQNPMFNKIIRTMYEDDRSVAVIRAQGWQVWYPMDKSMEVDRVNRRIKRQGGS
jgi:hypothetical protein